MVPFRKWHHGFFRRICLFSGRDITCVPRNVPHTTWSSPGTKSLWTYLFLDPFEMFRNVLPGNLSDFDLSMLELPQDKYILSKDCFPSIFYLVTTIIRELEEQKNNYQLYVRGLFLSLFVELHRLTLTELVASNKKIAENLLVIAPALNYIEDNYSQQFSVETLADLCHWTPTHFRRIFNQIMHTSPLNYITNTRITKACTLLRTTEESILSISESVGFHSVSSFNRYFKHYVQTSPREYRSEMQGKSNEKSGTPLIMEFSGWLEPE